jgi:hypothetical protein
MLGRVFALIEPVLRPMLSPLTSACERMVISAILGPCHDVGGNGFDYAMDGPVASVVVLCEAEAQQSLMA